MIDVVLVDVIDVYHIEQVFGRGKLWQSPACLLLLYISRDIINLANHHAVIRHGFPPPKIHTTYIIVFYQQSSQSLK